MTVDTAQAAAPARFRPASLEDVTAYARNVAWLLDVKHQQAQELLARIWGYADLHALQVELGKDRSPGPYVDGSTSNPGGVEFHFRQFNDILGAIRRFRKDPAHQMTDREALLLEAGLFFSPSGHRRAVRTLKALLDGASQAYDVSAVPPGVLAKLALHFAPEPGLDETPLLQFELLRPSSPDEYLKELASFRAPDILLALLPAIPPEDRHPLLPDNFPIEEYAEFGPDPYLLNDLSQCDEALFDHLVSVASRNAGKEEDDEWPDDDALLLHLSNFLDKPTADRARACPLLSSIPDPCTLVSQWRREYKIACAKAFVAERAPLLVLEGTLGDVVLRLRLTMCDETKDDDFGPLKVWDVKGVYMKKVGDGLSPFAAVSGKHIVPHDGNEYVSDDSFLWGLDSISAQMNDVWKVLTQEYFPSIGNDGLYSFMELHPYEDIAVLTVEILPQCRGQGLLPTLIALYEDLFAGFPYTSFDAHWAARMEAWRNGVADKDFSFESGEDEGSEYVLGVPGVIVFPVEGTRPSEPLRAFPGRVLDIVSSRKEVRAPFDPRAERRKQKLTQHFLALDAHVGADVICYDPWDYPIT